MSRSFSPLGAVLAVPALVLSAALGGCAATSTGDRPVVVASFYPLQFVAERIVGDHAGVENLTSPGVEPHDLELTVRQVAAISGAAVALYESGLQPAVDQAVQNNPPGASLDVADVVHLDQPNPAAGAEAQQTTDKSGNARDPHFWQDPTLLAKVAAAFATLMEHRDPTNAGDYRRNNAALQADLGALDTAFSKGLRSCAIRTVVVSHDAFEYLGRRYGLDIRPIAGLSPDAEPSPMHLGELADLIRTAKITTVFSERLASPKLANALAGGLGIGTAVLDPIEGLTSTETHSDYLTLMRANLAALRKANSCN